jgi:hypothetical protein
MGGGSGRHVHCTTTPNNCLNEDCVFCVATPCLICDDRALIIAVRKSNSTVFLIRDVDSHDHLRFGDMTLCSLVVCR